MKIHILDTRQLGHGGIVAATALETNDGIVLFDTGPESTFDNVIVGDIAGVRIGNGPPIPPFVPPELHVESWRESIAKIRRLDPAHLYLPHFGKVAGPISEHLDLLEEHVIRWSEWFREWIRVGADEPTLRSTFTELEHADLRKGGASQDDIAGYEAADPSYMAVGAAMRYWKKFHPEAVNADR